MIEIFYPRQQHTVRIDAEDFGVWTSRTWSITKGRNTSYLIATRSMLKEKSRKRVYFHRLVTAAPPGLVVDHKNGDGFDNRKANLRVCNYSQSNANRRKHSLKSMSKLKGVSWRQDRGYWEARVKINGVEHRVGCFKTETEAAEAYNSLAKRYFGEFACINS